MLSLLMMLHVHEGQLVQLHLRLDASHHWHWLQFSQQHSLQLLLVQLRGYGEVGWKLSLSTAFSAFAFRAPPDGVGVMARVDKKQVCGQEGVGKK